MKGNKGGPEEDKGRPGRVDREPEESMWDLRGPMWDLRGSMWDLMGTKEVKESQGGSERVNGVPEGSMWDLRGSRGVERSQRGLWGPMENLRG